MSVSLQLGKHGCTRCAAVNTGIFQCCTGFKAANVCMYSCICTGYTLCIHVVCFSALFGMQIRLCVRVHVLSVVLIFEANCVYMNACMNSVSLLLVCLQKLLHKHSLAPNIKQGRARPQQQTEWVGVQRNKEHKKCHRLKFGDFFWSFFSFHLKFRQM